MVCWLVFESEFPEKKLTVVIFPCDVCRILTTKFPANAPPLRSFLSVGLLAPFTLPSPGLGLKSDENFAIVKETWLDLSQILGGLVFRWLTETIGKDRES